MEMATMTNDERFEHQREAFRWFLAGLDERQCELIQNDIQLRLYYLHNMTPEKIVKGLYEN